MRTKLKQFRVALGLTQARVAAAVGVTQPDYQRWESGAAPIPEGKLKKLAKVLKTDPQAILGKHPPIEAGFYDDSVDADLDYYGEVSIHFLGGGAPLLLSISEGAFARLHRDLQGDRAFVTVESLANQTVIIRTKAIADLYFSSEAYDDYGPEHRTYANHVGIQMPDPRDWEIVEALATDGVGLEDFDPAHVQRVQDRVMITDQQYKDLVSQGKIKPEELETEKAKNQEETNRIFRTARDITYQLSTGQQRSVYVDSPENLFIAFSELTDFNGGDPSDDMIRLEAEGRHRTIFISKSGLDYVVIPTHKYKEGRVDADAAELDDSNHSND
ncbi:MAG: helix-turn-helix domain-containing protein [Betaproteobacteria bacterium]|nr:helix-turn-helix domain-containing protein [Betaproteobacteria bacterium]